MALCPFAINLTGTIPLTNYSRGPVAKIGMVGHVIVGSAGSAVSEFQKPGMQLSATYVIAGPNDRWADGALLQMMDNQDIAYAQSNGNWPPTSYNACEFAGDVTTPMSPAQLATWQRLLAWDSVSCGYPVTPYLVRHGQPGITTHCSPDGSPDPAWGNHPCPGPLRLEQFQQSLQGGGTTVPFSIDPPITLSAPMVDWHLTSAFPAGALILCEDGAVYTLGAAQYYGGANGQAYFVGRQAAQFGALTQAEAAAGKKYVILDSVKERYAFPR